MFVQSDPKIVAIFRLVSNVASVLCAIAGILVFIGWWFRIPWLQNPFPGHIPLIPLGAVLICISGLSCLLLSNRSDSKWCVYTGNFGAILVIVASALVLLKYFIRCEFDIETILFSHFVPEVCWSYLARAAPNEATGLLLGGVALLFLGRKSEANYFRSQLVAVLIGLVSLLALIGYFYGLPVFYGVAAYTQVAFLTAWLLLLLATAVFFAKPESGLASIMTSTGAGGVLVRRLLPTSVLMPFLFGWLKMYGQSRTWFEPDFATGLLILLMIITGTALVVLSGRHLNNLDEERARLTEQRENLMAVLTHDLKNPLIGADRVLELFVSGALGDVTPEQSKFLVKLKQSNEELLNNIQTLLELYRYDRGSEAMRFEEINLLDVLRACIYDAKPHAEGHNITLEERLPETIGEVNGDRTAIKHVVVNLINNAIKFTPEGEKIEISAQNLDGMVVIKVKDNGTGISKEEQESLFQPFSQGTLGKKYKTGTGLGLYLCSRIVKAHLGFLSCLSEAGAGATFVISLPAKFSPVEMIPADCQGKGN